MYHTAGTEALHVDIHPAVMTWETVSNPAVQNIAAVITQSLLPVGMCLEDVRRTMAITTLNFLFNAPKRFSPEFR